jgi:hypothetical protein
LASRGSDFVNKVRVSLGREAFEKRTSFEV